MTHTPDRIGPFRVLNPLGTRGLTYRGWDPESGRSVTLTLAEDGLDPERFLTVARRAIGLQHPHIAAVLAVGEDAGLSSAARPFVVSEFVQGRTLADRIRTRARMDAGDPLPGRRPV